MSVSMSSQLEIARSDSDCRKKNGWFVTKPGAAAAVLVVAILVVAVGLLVYFAHPCLTDKGRTLTDGTGHVTDGGQIGPVVTPATNVRPEDVRLPSTFLPLTYNVRLRPVLEPPYPFDGSVTITLDCMTTTDQITLHSVDLIVDQSSISLSFDDGSSAPSLRNMEFDLVREFLVLKFDGELMAGTQYTLGMDFRGNLSSEAGLSGLYLASYKDSNGQERNLATTQMQPTDARRAFPCWDEPAIKAKFKITLEHRPEMVALSNMDVETTQQETAPGWSATTFKESVKMPTYLLAFVVCDFVKIEKVMTNERTGASTMLRVYAPRDTIDSGEYALNITETILRHYEDFFNLSFPLEKLDQVAIPDFAAGAMENWGLILYRETALLYDPEVSSAGNKKRVAYVVAHELAHQWFGNIVSPAWWDDLWLNEGFASYVEYLGVSEAEPDWQFMTQFIVDTLQPVFISDSLTSSHPIQIPVNHPDEINEIFDSISYNKGASLIKMMRNFLGRRVFQTGLSRFLNKHKYGNAKTEDLWAALTQASELENKVDVSYIMNTWTLQMGYPVITISRDYNTNSVMAAQKRFLMNVDAKPNEKYISPYNYTWEVPLTYTTEVEQGWDNPTLQWMHMNQKSAVSLGPSSALPSADKWLIANVKAEGYYRVNYDRNNWQLLAAQLSKQTDGHKLISVENRAQLINDAFNLARAGEVDTVLALNLTKYMEQETDYLPWDALLQDMNYISTMLSETEAYGYFQAYMRQIVSQLYIRLTWTEDAGESILTVFNRINAISTACKYGLVECVERAKSEFKEWMGNPSSNNINTNLKSTVYCNGVRHGGYKEWQFAWQQYLAASVASEKVKLLQALSCSRDSWVLSTYLKMTLEDGDIKKQDGLSVINYVARNPIGRYIAWDFVTQHYSKLHKRYVTSGFTGWTRFMKSMTTVFNTKYNLEQFNAILELGPQSVESSGLLAWEQIRETIANNMKWMDRNYEEIFEWLKGNVHNINNQ